MLQAKHILIFTFALLLGCNQDKTSNNKVIVKMQDSDKFKNTLIESQFFAINSAEDNIIESKKGNVLIIPKGSLIEKNGKIVEDAIQIEFAEASDLAEIMLSNLMIQDSALLYESYLSFYFNATRKSEQLFINPENPIYFETSTDKRTQLFKGIRDSVGNMRWNEALHPVPYLVPVSLDLLDFLPYEFELEVEKGLPFRNHETISKKLLDSLYYSFANEIANTGSYSMNSRMCMINLYTPIFKLLAQEPALLDQHDTSFFILTCGINPASIKALKDKKFENTLIATREFENRLRTIFATCDNQVLELYVNNLNKNMWEIDEMAAKLLGNTNSQYTKFLEFASYKQTSVKLSDSKAKLLAEHYRKAKEIVENELIKIKTDFLSEKKKLEQVTQQKKDEYRSLLEARHKHRMKKFGFELTDFGWYNAARNVKLDDVEKFNLNITIINGSQFDRVYAYVINQKIRSIFSYLSDDKSSFNIVYSDDSDLLLWRNQKFNIIGVGYQANEIGYKIEEYTQQPIVVSELYLTSRDTENFKKDIKALSRGYQEENKIIADLEYQSFFFKEHIIREKEIEEMIFIKRLKAKVFPCCDSLKSESEW